MQGACLCDDGQVYVGGFIARMNPDGTNVEILAHGLRNSYENCVTSFGDIFASDNDDQPACRVFWVLEGGYYGFTSRDGKRCWQADRRPGQSIATATWRQEDPGVAPAGDIYGGGAPTGCVFYENGALDDKPGGVRLQPNPNQNGESQTAGKSQDSAGASPHQDKWEGTLLVCEAARNSIFGYKPQPDGAGWKLERFVFLTTNSTGEFAGTDFKGGAKNVKADDTKTLFRPSDIAVGPDGALYISDWLDPRVGGHADMDDALEGTIYRIAPKDFKPKVPKFNLTTVEGAIEALKSPAVHVRALGAEALRKLQLESDTAITGTTPETNATQRARLRYVQRDSSVHPLTLWRSLFTDGDPQERIMGIRLVGRRGTYRVHLAPVSFLEKETNPRVRAAMCLQFAKAGNPMASVLRNEDPLIDNSLGGLREQRQLLIDEAGLIETSDAYALEAFGRACGNKPELVFDALLPLMGEDDPLKWTEKFSTIAWRLHPTQSIPAFQTRALSPALPLRARLDALTAIGFNDTAEAAQAMLEVAVEMRARIKKSLENASEPGPNRPEGPSRSSKGASGASKGRSDTSEGRSEASERGSEASKGRSDASERRSEAPERASEVAILSETALWWLLNRKDSTWKAHGLNAALKEGGIYDPDKITLLPAPLPEPVAATFSAADAAKLPGDAKRGEAVSAKCFLCHRIGDQGADYGPDLTTFGRTQTTEALLRSLIEPDADIAHGFAGSEIVTTDGLTIAGMVLSESDPIIIRSAGGVTQMIPKARIKTKTGLSRSLMMSAAQLALTAQEAADVTAFLKQRK